MGFVLDPFSSWTRLLVLVTLLTLRTDLASGFRCYFCVEVILGGEGGSEGELISANLLEGSETNSSMEDLEIGPCSGPFPRTWPTHQCPNEEGCTTNFLKGCKDGVPFYTKTRSCRTSSDVDLLLGCKDSTSDLHQPHPHPSLTSLKAQFCSCKGSLCNGAWARPRMEFTDPICAKKEKDKDNCDDKKEASGARRRSSQVGVAVVGVVAVSLL